MNNGVAVKECATLSVGDVARLLGVGKTTFYEAVNRGEIPHIRVGGRIVISRRFVEKLLNGEQFNPGQATTKSVGAGR